MLGNSSVFMLVMMCFMVVLLLVGAAVAIIFTVKNIMASVRMQQKTRLLYSTITALCIPLAALGWILNFGWARLLFTMTMVPFFYTAIFLTVNMMCAKKVEGSLILKICMPISFISYLGWHIFLPDSGDSGVMYTFFGMIRDINVVSFFDRVSMVLGLIGIICIVVQLAVLIRERK